MEREEFKILLMDDEVETSGQAKLAYEELVKEGYQIEKCSKMSTVLKSYYQNFHHLYILDIDMQRVDDVIEGTGMRVGETLKRLSSISEILIFSALGTVDDWFKSANYSFRGYIPKQDGVPRLLDKVAEIYGSYNLEKDFSLAKEDIAERALVYSKASEQLIANKKIKELLENKGIQEVEILNKLDKVVDKIKQEKYKIILLFTKRFSNRSSLLKKLEEIIAVMPTPQVIISVYAKKGDINNVIPLVNLQPFRLLNLKWSNYTTRLEMAIDDGLTWYGKEEVFEFPDKDDLLKEPMSKEEIASIQKEKDELSEDDELWEIDDE